MWPYVSKLDLTSINLCVDDKNFKKFKGPKIHFNFKKSIWLQMSEFWMYHGILYSLNIILTAIKSLETNDQKFQECLHLKYIPSFSCIHSNNLHCSYYYKKSKLFCFYSLWRDHLHISDSCLHQCGGRCLELLESACTVEFCRWAEMARYFTMWMFFFSSC